MPNIGVQEIIIILVIALIVFGPKKLPEIGKALGQGLREFKKVSNELVSSIESASEEVEEETPAKSEEETATKKEEVVASKEGDPEC